MKKSSNENYSGNVFLIKGIMYSGIFSADLRRFSKSVKWMYSQM